jgi:NAD(P)-dependent dehydrogenase (short-subunit alcohol dehydrogenase family)
MHFKGKVAIVTGGSSGIGKEAAKRLVAHGASVVLGGRDEAKLHAAAKEVSEDASLVRILAGDIGKPATGTALVDLAEKEFGGLDILINNAGIFKPIPFSEVTETQYDSFLNTILKGKFFMAQAAAKAMKKRGGGAIVQTGSLWALQAIGATPSSAYSVANAGVHALVHNLALELAADKIRINAVAPGVVETPIYSTFLSKDEVPKVLPTFNAFHPLGRIGKPGDVAGAILFFASDESAWITGTVLPVDGGVMAGRN